MLSSRRSEVCASKGSMESARELKLGESGDGVAVRLLSEGGCATEGLAWGRVWRYEVRRWELWISRGSS